MNIFAKIWILQLVVRKALKLKKYLESKLQNSTFKQKKRHKISQNVSATANSSKIVSRTIGEKFYNLVNCFHTNFCSLPLQQAILPSSFSSNLVSTTAMIFNQNSFIQEVHDKEALLTCWKYYLKTETRKKDFPTSSLKLNDIYYDIKGLIQF